MANYPTLNYGEGSNREIDSGIIWDDAMDGTQRARTLYSEDYYTFNLSHNLITTSEKNTLLSFYSTYKTTGIVFNWPEDSNNYNVYFRSPPSIEWVGGDYWNATVTLRGTA
jgi:hypothetical protein